MKYELLLQPFEPHAPYDPSGVDALLEARGAVARADGTRPWSLKHGEVEARVLNEGGRAVATELRVPLTAKADLVRELVVQGCALADEAGLRLFDPQLTKSLVPADEENVAEQYLRTARYAGEYLGVPGAIDAGFGGPEPGQLKTGTKVALGIVGFVVVLYLIVDRLTG